MAIVKFEATKLAQKGKKGILTPDADGYYTTVIGGLNAVNTSGHWYSDAARYLFSGTDNNSIFQRRIKAGNLKGEAGHPKLSQGMSVNEFKHRLLVIEEKAVSHHIRRVYLDDSFGKNNPEYGNPSMIGIIAELKPAGPYGPALKAALDNPHENVCFSIRGFTNDTSAGGKRVRTLFEIVTFDWVTEPGISAATKWDSPACESASLEVIDSLDMNTRDLEAIVNDKKALALESDTVQLARSILNKVSATSLTVKSSALNISKW